MALRRLCGFLSAHRKYPCYQMEHKSIHRLRRRPINTSYLPLSHIQSQSSYIVWITHGSSPSARCHPSLAHPGDVYKGSPLFVYTTLYPTQSCSSHRFRRTTWTIPKSSSTLIYLGRCAVCTFSQIYNSVAELFFPCYDTPLGVYGRHRITYSCHGYVTGPRSYLFLASSPILPSFPYCLLVTSAKLLAIVTGCAPSHQYPSFPRPFSLPFPRHHLAMVACTQPVCTLRRFRAISASTCSPDPSSGDYGQCTRRSSTGMVQLPSVMW